MRARGASGTGSGCSVAVVGCGYWGKNLVRNFHELGALAQICEPGAAGQRTAAELAPDAELVADLDAVLDSGVSGVVIATPAETHFRIARRALEAGKDVFVEKPLALTCDDGARLVAMADERRRILMVGHVLEYHPALRKP